MVVLTLDRLQRSLQPRRRWPLKDVCIQPSFQSLWTHFLSRITLALRVTESSSFRTWSVDAGAVCHERKVSIRFRVFTPYLPVRQNDSDHPICPQPPHILSTARDVYGIVCALRAALIAGGCCSTERQWEPSGMDSLYMP